MCGILGFMSGYAGKASKETFMAVAADTATRGPQAWGVAWVDVKGRLRCYKENGDIRNCLKRAWKLVENARVFILHTRWATHGEKNNLNNHPHYIDGGWLIHNGVVGNYQELAQRPDIGLLSDCDSEILCRLGEINPGRLPDRMKQAVDMTTGNLAIACLWHKPDTMVLARRGNPLHVGRDETGLWFSSNGVGFPSVAFKANTLIEYRYKGGLPMVYRKRQLAEGRVAQYHGFQRFDPSGRAIGREERVETAAALHDSLMSGTNWAGMPVLKKKKNRNKYQHRQPQTNVAKSYTTTVIRPNRIVEEDEDKTVSMDEWLERQRERDAIVHENANRELTYERLSESEGL